MSNTQKGAVGGAAAGGAIGGIIGHQSGNTAVGAIIGAAVGGAAGAWIGHYMDKQAAEIQRDLEGATVERVGEGIKITFDSGLLFDANKSVLKPASKENLTKLAVILNKYPDTEILLEGHADSEGTEEHNMDLSQRRANSVAAYMSLERRERDALHHHGVRRDAANGGPTRRSRASRRIAASKSRSTPTTSSRRKPRRRPKRAVNGPEVVPGERAD